MNKTILSDNKKGYILEVDLEYPEELHELHNDYPLTAEKMICFHHTVKLFRRSLE